MDRRNYLEVANLLERVFARKGNPYFELLRRLIRDRNIRVIGKIKAARARGRRNRRSRLRRLRISRSAERQEKKDSGQRSARLFRVHGYDCSSAVRGKEILLSFRLRGKHRLC